MSSGNHPRVVSGVRDAIPYKDFPGVVSIDVDTGHLCIELEFHRDSYLANRLFRRLSDGYCVILREIQSRVGDGLDPEELPAHLKRAWKFALILSETAAHTPRSSEDGKS